MSTYQFSKRETTSFAEVRERNALDQQQVLTTLQIRNHSTFDSMDAAAAALRDEFDSDELLELERLEITRDGETQPRFVLWLYFSEHGIVFDMSTGLATPVHCVQCHFWSVDDDDQEAVALAAALDDLDF